MDVRSTRISQGASRRLSEVRNEEKHKKWLHHQDNETLG